MRNPLLEIDFAVGFDVAHGGVREFSFGVFEWLKDGGLPRLIQDLRKERETTAIHGHLRTISAFRGEGSEANTYRMGVGVGYLYEEKSDKVKEQLYLDTRQKGEVYIQEHTVFNFVDGQLDSVTQTIFNPKKSQDYDRIQHRTLHDNAKANAIHQLADILGDPEVVQELSQPVAQAAEIAN